MKTSAKSFLRLVLVAGGTIAKSCPLSTSCRWLVAVAFRSPSDHERFFGKKPNPLNAQLPLAAFFLSRSRCSFRPIVVWTTFNWTWWHLSRSFISLCCWTLAVEFYCIPTDRTAFGIRTWRRLVLHVRLRLVFFGGDGVWACHASSCMTCFLLAASFRPFQRRRFPARAIPLKKKNRFLRTFSGPWGFVRTPAPPIATPLMTALIPCLLY